MVEIGEQEQRTEAEMLQREVTRFLSGAAKARAEGDIPLAMSRMHAAQERIGALRDAMIEDALAKR
jgi:hypothetical protein